MLVQRVLKIESYSDARAWIEREAPAEQKEVGKVVVRIKSAPLSFRLPEEARFGPVDDWPGPARSYLRTRGIEDWQVERWGIGYAVVGRLKGRILLVSRDVAGRPLRYTARSFIDDPKRYLEPLPDEKANPNAMFGEEHWPLLNGDEDRSLLFVVEGAINALALEAELPGAHVCATAGSSMRGLYGLKIGTWAEICLVTDPDDAGDRLAGEIGAMVARHSKVDRIRLEKGFDPAKLRELRPGELGNTLRGWLLSARKKSGS
jgi:hypothetical protein